MSDTSTLDESSDLQKPFDLSYAITIAREIYEEFSWFNIDSDEIAQEYIRELHKALSQFSNFVDSVFAIKSPQQDIELDYETLSELMDLNIALKRLGNSIDLDEKVKAYLDLSTLEYIAKMPDAGLSSRKFGALISSYQDEQVSFRGMEDLDEVDTLKLHILGKLSSRLTYLIGNGQVKDDGQDNQYVYKANTPVTASYFYMALRERIARAADANWISDQDLQNFYTSRVKALVPCIGGFGFEKTLQEYVESAQLLRAAVKNRPEEQRAEFRDTIRRQSADILSATRRKTLHAFKIVRGELRGFLKSLEIPGGLASDKHGGYLETAVHGSERFQSKLNLSRFGIYGMSYGLINAGLYAISTEGRISPVVALTSLSLATVGLFNKNAKNTRAINAQIADPQRPNAPKLFDEYRRNSTRTKIVEVKDGDRVVDSHIEHLFPSPELQKEIDALGKRIRNFERDVVTDPSAIVPTIPHSFTEFETVPVAENLVLPQR